MRVSVVVNCDDSGSDGRGEMGDLSSRCCRSALTAGPVFMSLSAEQKIKDQSVDIRAESVMTITTTSLGKGQ